MWALSPYVYLSINSLPYFQFYQSPHQGAKQDTEYRFAVYHLCQLFTTLCTYGSTYSSTRHPHIKCAIHVLHSQNAFASNYSACGYIYSNTLHTHMNALFTKCFFTHGVRFQTELILERETTLYDWTFLLLLILFICGKIFLSQLVFLR